MCAVPYTLAAVVGATAAAAIACIRTVSACTAVWIYIFHLHPCRGQDITSSQSHKSYRPLTILAFRLTHQAWKLLTAAMPGIIQLLPKPSASQSLQNEALPVRPDGGWGHSMGVALWCCIALCFCMRRPLKSHSQGVAAAACPPTIRACLLVDVVCL